MRGKGIDIVLGNSRRQTFFRADFERFGIKLEDRGIIVVKSSQHFYDSFSSLTTEILYVDTPAVLTKDVTTLPYKHITRPKWPLDQNPFG